MNLKEIKEILGLMKEHEISEIEVEREGSKIKICKGSQGFSMVAPSMVPAPMVNVGSATPMAPNPSQPPLASSGLKEIKAPMVGTFYRAPSPDAPPFVEIGQIVEVGQVVCILEAMKLMNEIKSDIRGKVVDVKVQNAEPVEFGTVLFLIETA